METLHAIHNYLGINVQEDWIQWLSREIFSNASPTFRLGLIGQWREYFDEEMKDLFKLEVGDYLIRFGYERDDRW